MEDVHVNDSQNISRISYAWQWKWTGIAVTDDNSWVVIGISAVSCDVASLEYVENMISGCKDEWVSSMGDTEGAKMWTGGPIEELDSLTWESNHTAYISTAWTRRAR